MSDAKQKITRREALKIALAGSALAATGLLLGAGMPGDTEAAPATPSPAQDDRTLLEDIADTLLPTTPASPGARAAGVGAMMVLMLADCESPETQQRVATGLQELRAACRERGGSFASLPVAERERLLTELDAAAQKAGDKHWFNSVRALALQTYFNSEVGLTQALRYIPVPGRYDGCVPLEPGQPAWA